ncbi:MAG: hypothetical protein K2Q22_03140 [Cytophagales bacterium]|nr:hypothetical protein [Cytophagales bacterium]
MHPPAQLGSLEEKIAFDGYPLYPSSEDIYENGTRTEFEEDPLDVPVRALTEDDAFQNYQELDFNEEVFGEDLDVPGSELDDLQESVGSEDEENNFYSLGDEPPIDSE